MDKFKVGDKVEIVNPDVTSQIRGYRRGDCFAVKALDPMGAFNNKHEVFYFNELQLISKG
jgi:hypothetical protein